MSITTTTSEPTSMCLHINCDTTFTAKFGKKLKAIGGRYSDVRGYAAHRYVTVPATYEGRVMATEILKKHGLAETTVVVRDTEGFPAWVSVTEVPRTEAAPMKYLFDRYRTKVASAIERGIEPRSVREAREQARREELALAAATARYGQAGVVARRALAAISIDFNQLGVNERAAVVNAILED